MDYIVGEENTETIESTQLYPDIDDKIYILEPIDTPLTAFLTQIGKIRDGGSYKGSALLKESAESFEFKEFEDQFSGIFDAVNNAAGYAANATAIVVDNSKIFAKYDIVKVVRTGEHFRINSIAYNTHTLTVQRAFGTTAAAAILDNDVLMVVASAYEESAGKGQAISTKKVVQTNYTQIFRTPFGVSKTLDASKTYPGKTRGSELQYQSTKNGIEHAKKIERAYWFGEKYEDTAGPDGEPVRSTGGIIEAIVAAGNVYDMADEPLTLAAFTEFLQTYAFNYGSSQKKLFCGPAVLAAIESFAQDKLQLKQGDNTFGVAVRQYISAFGILDIVLHPDFKGEYAGMGVVVDMKTLKHKVLRDTRLNSNIQTNGDDKVIHEYLTECGLARVNFEKNAMIINVGTGS